MAAAAKARGLDHVVIAVRDLDLAAEAFEALGFTLTPRARHPWGTENRLVQLDGAFLELLTVPAGAAIVPATGTAYSFGRFNQDFLETREGASMLVLDSTCAAEDRAAFAAAGLQVFDPFSFGREATAPDGTVRKVGFDLTFTRDADAPEIGFFTCHNLYPENFWRPEFQRHANGVTALAEVILVARDPADHHIFLEGFAGVRELRATSLGIECQTARGKISILSPVAYRHLLGDAAADALPGKLPCIAALRVTGTSVAAQSVIPAGSLCGVTLVIEPA